jgi:DNA-binding CsgD family transcriptional regulator
MAAELRRGLNPRRESPEDKPASSGLAFYSRSGELRVDAAARQLLQDDAQRGLVLDRLRAYAHGLVLAHEADSKAARQQTQLLTTEQASYKITLSWTEEHLPGSDVVVMATIQTANDAQTSAKQLQERFGFTPREAEVVLLIIARHGNPEIAERLCISRHTARHHVQRILMKLGVSSRSSARKLMLAGTQ